MTASPEYDGSGAWEASSEASDAVDAGVMECADGSAGTVYYGDLGGVGSVGAWCVWDGSSFCAYVG